MKKINYNGNYLYCSIAAYFTASDLASGYSSSEDLYNDYKDDIIEESQKRGYNENEVNAILSHYKIEWDNYNGKWGSDL